MATKLQTLAMTIACIAILLSASEAQPANNCKVDTQALMSCYPCIKNTNPDPNPSATCCDALKKADLPCLCSYRNSPDVKKYDINPDLAVKLPGKCGLGVPAGCR